MGWCDCHVNNVFQSIIWGIVVITVRVVSHGRRLKVNYDLSRITDRPSNLLRLEDMPRCILKYSFSISTWPEREEKRRLPRCLWHLSGCFDWCPIRPLFLLEAQFQFHFVCWRISTQQWISCEVVCFNHSGRNVRTLFSQNRGKL